MKWSLEDKLKFIKQYKKYGIIQSMSRKGNCLDNAKMEGFFGLLKREMFYGSEFHYHNFNQFKRALINYIH